MEDGRCKLGLQGRLALVLLVEQGSTLRAAAAALERRAGDGAPLVASLAGRQPHRADVAGVSAHAVLATAVVSVGAEQ